MRRRVLASLSAICFLATVSFAASFTQTTYPHGNMPHAVVSADINRDGYPDVIGAYRTPDTGVDHGFLNVLIGNSAGFASGQNFSTTSNPVDIAAGDYNSDGYPDVIVLEDDGYQLFFSAKNGALIPQPETKFGCDNCGGTNILAVDLNGDHIPDYAFTVCGNGGCALHTDINDGTGRFIHGGQSTGLDGYAPVHSLVAADFNRDNIDDLAVVGGTKIQIFRSIGGGAFVPLQTLSPTGTPLFALAAGDIDARNGPDLVFGASPSCFPDCLVNPTVYEYLNNGSGTLSRKAVYTVNSNATSALALIDITGENRLDLIAMNGALQLNSGSISWAHYAGSGTYGSFTTLLQMGNPMDLIGRDFNLDSHQDLTVADQGHDLTTPGTVVLKNVRSDAYICRPPSSANLSAKFCAPSVTASSRTIEVRAAGNSPTGVRRVELWIDGKKFYNSPDDRLKTVVSVASGTHKFVAVAVDRFGKFTKTTKYVSVP